ncbi:hypothetical protein TNCT_243811 [Trichonephila clavata]|uniref:Uncharacterized protein n=2 Tax=Trichonephila clavata TaxID=2740835 RepID=A0A8X6LL37_TRICU|nr:hypothetical protein TNCT_243811 [Trichonephila clavata]
MFKNCRKEDLRMVALELGETLSEKVTIVELTEIIKENKYFKEDVEFVKELIQYTIEDRKKAEEDRKKAEEARLREKELELELARLHRVNSDNERTDEGYNSLDALVKSVRILTVKVPNRPEEQKTVNRDMVVQTVKSDIITPYITQSERETRKSKVKRKGPLTTNEVNESETWLIKQDQSGSNLSDPSGILQIPEFGIIDMRLLRRLIKYLFGTRWRSMSPVKSCSFNILFSVLKTRS